VTAQKAGGRVSYIVMQKKRRYTHLEVVALLSWAPTVLSPWARPATPTGRRGDPVESSGCWRGDRFWGKIFNEEEVYINLDGRAGRGRAVEGGDVVAGPR